MHLLSPIFVPEFQNLHSPETSYAELAEGAGSLQNDKTELSD